MYFGKVGYIFCLNSQGLAFRLRLTCRCFGIWMVHNSHVGNFSRLGSVLVWILAIQWLFNFFSGYDLSTNYHNYPCLENVQPRREIANAETMKCT